MLKGQIMLSAKIFSIVLVHVVVQFYSWFNFFSLWLILIICYQTFILYTKIKENKN